MSKKLTEKSKENYEKILDDPNYLSKFKIIKSIVSPNIETLKKMVPVIPKYNYSLFPASIEDFDLSLVPELKDNPNLIKYFQGYKLNNLKVFYSSDKNQKIPEIYLQIIAFFDKNRNKTGKIYIYDYHSPRAINLKYGFDVTSGLTYRDIVVVSRTEETVRLLIHELIHFYEIITPADSLYDTHNYCNVSPADSFFEAKTEALAIIYNILFFEPIKFEKLLIDELLFSVYQASKILEIAGFNSYQSFISGCSKPMNFKIPYFSYLFLRSIFLFNLKDFLKNPNKPNSEVSPYLIEILNDYIKMKKNDYMGYNLIDYK
jgi:hypothetical protein